MNIRIVVNLLGRGALFIALAMVAPLLISFYHNEDDLYGLVTGFLVCLATGAVMLLFSRRPRGELRHREGFLFVTLAWSLAGLLGAIPFSFSGYFPSYIDALFETVSGFTTTGASVLSVVEVLPHGLLIWRSLIQWLGGMGIIVLTIAILPYLGVGGMQIFKAESPGPTMDKLKPRITETAKLLWGLYVGITFLEIILLCVGGMNGFDACCHAFTTMATGGFSTKTAGIAAYDSAFIDAVITVFMLIAGTNFALHYAALNGNVKRYFLSQEFRWYFGIFIFACAFILWSTRHTYSSVVEALRYVSFQVSSILTTTGFATYDYVMWPVAAQSLLLFIMIVGGCAGSTSGGIKVMRLGLLIKIAHREILKLVHPNAVVSIKWDKSPVSSEVVNSIVAFSIFYALIFVLATLIMAMLGQDFITSVSSVIACMSNIGPGLASVGPAGNYEHIPNLGKALLAFCMLIGRLEIYTILVVLSPVFWRR
ncbi:MAG TPA: TrkH family potassium uptake protein [Deltaproteobacteria bacterium]|nr:TrkH family potassium uptake protein [Deltaproteobacteria bacterium]